MAVNMSKREADLYDNMRRVHTYTKVYRENEAWEDYGDLIAEMGTYRGYTLYHNLSINTYGAFAPDDSYVMMPGVNRNLLADVKRYLDTQPEV